MIKPFGDMAVFATVVGSLALSVVPARNTKPTQVADRPG
jgi:hypothetical protein